MPDHSKHRHFISVKGMDANWLQELFVTAMVIKINMRTSGPQSLVRQAMRKRLSDYTVGSIFYEASTRTRFSFELAAKYLGADVVETEAAGMFSSAKKGESLADTIRVLASYHLDAIILRHGTEGSAEEAADCNVCSIINAGDGPGQHPTQALLDWFTLYEQFAGKQDVLITLVGDLLYGRTIHSLIELACELRGAELGFVQHVQLVAHEELALPQKYYDMLDAAGISYSHVELDSSEVRASHAIYMTRTQVERAEDTDDEIALDQVGADYALTPDIVSDMSSGALIMHPLPRNAEIPTSIDLLPQAYYLQQAQNGLYVRMALLLWIFGKLDEEGEV